MKYKLKEYASALAELMSLTGEERKALMNAFINLLKKNGELKNAKKIIDLAEKYYLKKKGNKKVVIQTARKTNTKDYFNSVFAPGDFLEEKISKDLVAGVKITINGEKQIDFSLQKKLSDIFK